MDENGLVFERGDRIAVPCGVLHFAKEEPMPPRAWVERAYNVVRWTEKAKGGHFAAWEEPEVFAADVREFVAPLRDGFPAKASTRITSAGLRD